MADWYGWCMAWRTATRRTRGLVVFALVLLMVSACASGSADDAATTDPTDGSTAAATDRTANSAVEEQPAPAGAAAEDDDDAPAVNEVYVSPIGEALGVAQDEQAAAFDTYVRDAEELVRQCMAEAGFEYDPTPSGLDRATRRQFELQETLTAEQFTVQYGFGIATLFELNFKDEGVVDFVNQQFGPPPTEQRSPGEQAAYELALNGESTQGLSAEEAQEQLFGGEVGASLDGSCRSYGYDTAENPGAVFDGLFSLLGDEITSLNDRFESDPRIRQEMSEWQSCMATAGHSFEDPFEIITELQSQADDLANEFLSSPQVLAALGEAQAQGFTSMDAEARQGFLEDVGALQGFAWVPDVQAEFDELIAFELQVAADSVECSDEELILEVQFEYETEFVEAHADQLALIAAGDA